MKTEKISNIAFGFVVSILMLSGFAFAQGFQDIVSTLKNIGVFQFYLPFLISFAVLYALLLKTKIFGENKSLVVIIALASAAFIMVYTPFGITFSEFLTRFMGNTMVVILTVVVILIFVNMLQSGGLLPDKDLVKGNTVWILLLLLVLVVFGVFVASGGTEIFPGLKVSGQALFGPIGGFSTNTLALIILVVGTGLIVWIFGKKDNAGSGGKTGG